MVAVWHSLENRALLRTMGMSELNIAFVVHMVRFAWSRSAQQLLIIFMATTSIIAYDWHHLGLSAPSIFSAAIARPPALSVAQIASVAPLPQVNPQWVSPIPQPVAQDTRSLAELAPAAGGIRQVPNITPSAQDELDAMRQAGLVQQIYEPEQSASTQTEIDKIKQSYEDILVTFFFLQKCDHAKEEDYMTIHYALSRELRAFGADSHVESDVITAAKGSYQEIYSKISCASQDLNAIETQFMSYTQTLAQSVPNTASPLN